ncbi:fatty acid desaturase [Leptolyngbya cf. ectocarpi LEGE 11479]|uniref:Fatty acid desaturase n=1 Tax=Leptolyngbya cf. ectocarpi LEGE 11479 TaxID=1828722 RepID=A0A928ZWM2_LEPEC|nr:fatty acid desaturase [Leptolyngbya ectocarpi]MBE9068745.1 fatty acid desaturase [Leptolyngbya cf. ectocarpi LEGE 11479]
MTANSVQKNPETRVSLSWITVIFFTLVHILALLAPWYFSWQALGMTLLLHWLLGSIGICLGYHRLLSHRSFQVPKWLEYVIAVIGTLALQGGPIFWVAGHRLHHAHTEDEADDPYSAKRGFWWSHMLWMLYPDAKFFDPDQYSRYAPELARDPVYQWLNRYFLLLQIPLGLLLYSLGGWSFVIYGVFLRAVLLWHSTWFINSVTHMWGYRTFSTQDNSRNLWWAAILTYGEGWHNNHHAYPNVARAGWQWWEIDVTWWAIWLLKMLGLAKKVVKIPAHVSPLLK